MEGKPQEVPCIGCSATIKDYVAEYCCTGSECGCKGLPIDPPLCSKCWYDRIQNPWQNFAVLPEMNQMVELLCDDYMGDYTIYGWRKAYKKPQRGGKTWRWVKQTSYGFEKLSRKETPSKWRPILGGP